MIQEVVRKKILIVDDSSESRHLIRESLKRYSYEISEAENGMDALAMLKHNVPDLIVLDLMMPKMDGLKVCAFIKSDKRFWNIPVIMITAMAEKSAKKLSEQVKVDVFMNKPLVVSEFLQKVHELI